MDWSGVDYVFVSCLDSHSDGTHSLQRIHWWTTDVMLKFFKSVLMKKQTHMAWDLSTFPTNLFLENDNHSLSSHRKYHPSSLFNILVVRLAPVLPNRWWCWSDSGQCHAPGVSACLLADSGVVGHRWASGCGRWWSWSSVWWCCALCSFSSAWPRFSCWMEGRDRPPAAATCGPSARWRPAWPWPRELASQTPCSRPGKWPPSGWVRGRCTRMKRPS